MVDALEELAPGDVIAERWRVGTRIGRGSMGAVFEAEHVDDGTPAALKVMHREIIADDDLRGRFRQECLVTAAVACEHVVSVLDAGTDVERLLPYLAMERLWGMDLAARIAERGPLGRSDAVDLLAQTAAALDQTHAAGIVHRDINPKNLFVTAGADDALRIKVLDFGIAKILAASPHAAATLAAGTPFYMAPEQLTGEGDIDGSADRLALGHVAFTALTGAAYFQDEHERGLRPVQLVSAIAGGPVEPASERAARRGVALPAAFDTWFATATHPRRDARFRSAAEQMKALAGVLGVHRSVANPARRRSAIDGPRCEALAGRASAGDDAAWQTLVGELWPFWLRAVRYSPAMGPLGDKEDHVNDVVARLVEKMSPRGGGALGTYPAWKERHPAKTFADWLRIVTAFTVRDHVRHTLGRGTARDHDVPSPKRLLNEFATSPSLEQVGDWSPSYTTAQLAQRLIAFARERLSDAQYDALTSWLQGADYDEIGAGDEEAGRKLLRAAIAVLRRQFKVD